MEQEEYNPLLK